MDFWHSQVFATDSLWWRNLHYNQLHSFDANTNQKQHQLASAQADFFAKEISIVRTHILPFQLTLKIQFYLWNVHISVLKIQFHIGMPANWILFISDFCLTTVNPQHKDNERKGKWHEMKTTKSNPLAFASGEKAWIFVRGKARNWTLKLYKIIGN